MPSPLHQPNTFGRILCILGATAAWGSLYFSFLTRFSIPVLLAIMGISLLQGLAFGSNIWKLVQWHGGLTTRRTFQMLLGASLGAASGFLDRAFFAPQLLLSAMIGLFCGLLASIDLHGAIGGALLGAVVWSILIIWLTISGSISPIWIGQQIGSVLLVLLSGGLLGAFWRADRQRRAAERAAAAGRE
jgi:hypothetical protein